MLEMSQENAKFYKKICIKRQWITSHMNSKRSLPMCHIQIVLEKVHFVNAF